MNLTHVVQPDEHGLRLESVLRGSMGISASQLRKVKRNCMPILLDGHTCFTNQRVSEGQRVEIALPSYEADHPVPLTAAPSSDPLRNLFEDESLIIVWKPAFLETHASRSRPRGSDTLEQRVSQAISAPVHPVHRLDAETSGPVVFAKHPYIQHTLQKAMSDGQWVKEYHAAVFHAPDPSSGHIEGSIRRETPDSFTRIVAEDGKAARTQYDTLLRTEKEEETVSLLSLRPLTGRTHQLRVHLMHIGCPILGDKRYFTPESAFLSGKLGLKRQQLCCVSLSFPHPITKGTVIIRQADDLECRFENPALIDPPENPSLLRR